jgi:hypothetical protein
MPIQGRFAEDRMNRMDRITRDVFPHPVDPVHPVLTSLPDLLDMRVGRRRMAPLQGGEARALDAEPVDGSFLWADIFQALEPLPKKPDIVVQLQREFSPNYAELPRRCH